MWNAAKIIPGSKYITSKTSVHFLKTKKKRNKNKMEGNLFFYLKATKRIIR